MESAEGRRATVVETLAGYLVQERGASPEDARARAHRLIDQASEEVRGAVQAFAGHWWLFTLRGVLSVIVGFLFFASSAAAANPAIAATFSVPARRPRSCPPPRISGSAI